LFFKNFHSWNPSKAKCFDFAINYYPFGYINLITKLCILFTSSILLKISLVKN